MKLCLNCKKCDVYEGFGGSDVTPPYGMELLCQKGHWRIKDSDTSKRDIRSKLTTAEICKDYEPEDAP